MTNSKRLSSADVDTLSTEYSAVDATKTASFEQLALGQKVSIRPERNDAKWYRKLFALPAYYWILIAQVVVVLPHAAHLPLWLIGFAAVSIAAQLPHIKAKFKKTIAPKAIYQSVQMLGFLLGLLGLWLTYSTAFGLDMGVAFLVLCLVSKLWELYKRRDAYVVLNLSLFVLAALFLMDQGLLTTLEVIVGAVIVLLAFIALNDDSNASGDGRLRTLGVLGVGALPLLLVLFLFFPRLPPLCSVQLSGQQAVTGVSNSMSPGDFANLGQSTELAFRVEFADERPPQQQLYWRGLVFSDFDGVTWRPASQKGQWSSRLQAPAWIQNAFATVPDESRAAPVNYKVILEPTQQNWLFGLDYPFSQQPDINTTSDFTLTKDQPVTQQLRYDVSQFASMRIDPVLTKASRRENLALPNEGNPQARALAKQLFEQSGSDPVRYIAAIEQWINRTEFRYTLSPPRLNTNRIDEFLFETKAGFCEHYSSSFTFMLRAAGIPARVVAGYQAGEPSRNGNVWEVRQMDAHAWTEVWLEGQGWVRVDPTAFVAPERVEQGMNTMTEQQGAAMFGNGASAQISYQQYQMLQTLRRLSDQASYYWQKDVVGYDQDKQADSLLKWFNISSIMQQIIWLATSAVSVMAILVFVIWYRRRKRWHPADLPLAQLSKRVAKHDKLLARNDNEGSLGWNVWHRLLIAVRMTLLISTSQLTDSNDPIVIQAKLIEIRQNYRQLRYGRLSTFDSSHSKYQERLKQLKKRCTRIVIKVFDDSVIKLLRYLELTTS
ncbi:LOW QUALITY PROTEIN: transglutaminase-like enzyme, putative cysteine protease [Psychrobacter sp. JCM 18900]|nr:LOW QUALITY PROTEIN: transglutaminase-like enzyme, putative cysteine protease [Psychrobacter sp. JCM 18900]